MAQSDSRIKVHHKANGGIASARNYGLDHATGSYIGFCDQDDEVSGDMYQKMIERLTADQSQTALCGCYRRKSDGQNVIFEKYTDALLDRQHILQKLLYPMLFKGFACHENNEISIYPAIWKCIISKQLIDDHQIKFNTFVNYEDDLIMLLQLDNLAATKDHNIFRRIKEDLCCCESIRYLQLISHPIAPQKGFVRNTMIIPLLRKNHIFTAYFLNQLINSVRFFVERHYVAERLERHMKNRPAGYPTSRS